MIIDELTLHDFAVYRGRQTVHLTPPNSNQPIILFGGLNGGGKTTLLDAIQLVIFGPFSKCLGRNGLSYPKFLESCIHRGSGTREAALELSFRNHQDGRENTYKLHRSWRMSNGVCKEHFEVLRDEQVDRNLTDNWLTQVEDFFPSNIAHLFLFDGEKVESYASPSSSAELIGTAIQSLLGLDIVDQLERDLETYERQKQMDAKSDSDRALIDKCELELVRARKELDELKQERASVDTVLITQVVKKLNKVEDDYIKIGGELYEQREAIEAKVHIAETQVQAGHHRLRESAEGCLPFSLCGDLLTKTYTRSLAEAECRLEKNVLSTVHERDTWLLGELRSLNVSSDAFDRIRTMCEEDRERRGQVAKNEIHLDLSPSVENDFHNLLNQECKFAKSQAAQLLSDQSRFREALEQARLELASIPPVESLTSILDSRSTLREELRTLEAKRSSLEEEIAKSQRNIERMQVSLTQILTTNTKATIEQGDRKRILRHSSKVRATLAEFRSAVVARHIDNIENQVLECFQKLLRKTSLVRKLHISPLDFTLTLVAHDNNQLSSDKLSAGERQLLAVALLWGLARASGRTLPTAIDTPLGRLDKGHRLHLVERYFPFASHQVLLLSTDEEISGDYLSKLSPWIGRTYKLEFDDATGATHIREGYFSQKEAA